MMKPSILLILLTLISPCSQSDRSQQKPAEPVSYCDLFRKTDQYPAGQPVRVRATWTHGFEWSYLSDRECLDQPKAWVEFVADDELCSASKPNLKKMTQGFDNKADVVVVGKLEGGGGYGHMGAYRYKFVVTCLESYKTIPVTVP
ncbi:MAG TPA: hypothetical protein VEM96_00745 [Pyrinomonadaceae bacterium]|nr:hypothetical protein [Pyrinomonadaceae bacterium]